MAATVPPPDYGQSEGEWPLVPTFQCSAMIAPKLGGEKILGARLTGVNAVNITIRQSTQSRSVTTDWKVVDPRLNVTYAIRSKIDPDQGTPRQGRYYELLCEEGTPP
jgi:hypothetical protein